MYLLSCLSGKIELITKLPKLNGLPAIFSKGDIFFLEFSVQKFPTQKIIYSSKGANSSLHDLLFGPLKGRGGGR